MAKTKRSQAAVGVDVAGKIRSIRGQRVLLDADLAVLYGVPTKRLNEQVRRNLARFPPDFLFQLTSDEAVVSRSQFATLNAGRGHNVKHLPLAFTEHGAIMVATVLNSPLAVEMSVHVVRAFVRLRQILASNTALARRLESLERTVATLDAGTRKEFVRVYKAILKLMGPPSREQ